MSQPPDLREYLEGWRYDPERNVRITRVASGREIIVVRQPMGLEEYELDCRPDAQRPHGMESAFEFHRMRLAAARSRGSGETFKLDARDCAELFEEGTLYYCRSVHFLRLKVWARAESDIARNLCLLDFVGRYAACGEDRVQLEQWRADSTRMQGIADAMILLEKGEHRQACKIASERVGMLECRDQEKSPLELANALLQVLHGLVAIVPTLRPSEDSVFRREGDYWTIIYQGQVARLKATRGLYFLAALLRNPGREFHVSELLMRLVESPVPVVAAEQHTELQKVNTLHAAGLTLDARAKGQYKHRLEELRRDFAEAEQFHDSERAAGARYEMDSIAEQMVIAVGLGGRDRRTGSDAERARSAVTRRIKESVHKIAELTPSLGGHLGARIKTGYFCSYNPHPDHPVAWKF